MGNIEKVERELIKRIRKIRGEKLEMNEDLRKEMWKWGMEYIVFIDMDKRMGWMEENIEKD